MTPIAFCSVGTMFASITDSPIQFSPTQQSFMLELETKISAQPVAHKRQMTTIQTFQSPSDTWNQTMKADNFSSCPLKDQISCQNHVFLPQNGTGTQNLSTTSCSQEANDNNSNLSKAIRHMEPNNEGRQFQLLPSQRPNFMQKPCFSAPKLHRNLKSQHNHLLTKGK